MKLLWYLLFISVIVFLSMQLTKLIAQTQILKKEYAELTKKTKPLIQENEKVRKEIEEFKYNNAWEREFRRAGYAAPSEKVFIIVPKP